MSNNKSQISPIPPEGYGDRFVKFISGLTMTKEEVEREAQAPEQLDGSLDISTNRQASFQFSRTSTDKVIDKAERQAHISEKEGASEDPVRDRTLGAVRSPSAERSGGITGSTLPVVEEDGEAGSREDSLRDEKAAGVLSDGSNNDLRSSPARLRDAPASGAKLPSIPNFNRLSMGLGSTTPSVTTR